MHHRTNEGLPTRVRQSEIPFPRQACGSHTCGLLPNPGNPSSFVHKARHPSSVEKKENCGEQKKLGEKERTPLNRLERESGEASDKMNTVEGNSSDRFHSPSAIFSYLGRNLDGLMTDSTATAFSDYSSDRSGEFSPASGNRSLLVAACMVDRQDGGDEIAQLVSDLESDSLETQRSAAMEIRLLAKHKMENRVRIADAGAIGPLVALAQSPEEQIQELGVTALLNISLCDENKEKILRAGAIRALVRALRTGTATAKENAACAILRLSHLDEIKAAIGLEGAIPPLVRLLESGSLRGKKDAAGALYALTTVKENKVRAVEAGVMRPLVDLMTEQESGMVDKAALVTLNLVSATEARAALVKEDGIPVLVEVVEDGTHRQKEFAAGILLELCEDSAQNRGMVAREGAIPPLVALSQSGTTRARQRAETLIRYLRQPRSGGNGARRSEISD